MLDPYTSTKKILSDPLFIETTSTLTDKEKQRLPGFIEYLFKDYAGFCLEGLEKVMSPKRRHRTILPQGDLTGRGGTVPLTLKQLNQLDRRIRKANARGRDFSCRTKKEANPYATAEAL